MDDPSTSTYDVEVDEEDNGIIGGVDAKPHLMGTEEVDEDDELMRAMNRFMRNEMDYDEFMRVTGGTTLADEMADKGKNNTIEDGEEEEIDLIGDEEFDDLPPIEDAANEVDSSYVDVQSSYENLPTEARVLMNQILTGNYEPPPSNLAEALKPLEEEQEYSRDIEQSDKPPKKIVKFEIVDEDEEDYNQEEEQNETKDRGKKKRMDALLGQANVLCARGAIRDAKEVLLEVIRQDSRNTTAYQQLSSLHEQIGDSLQAYQFGVLAAFLDQKGTPAEEWAHWGCEAIKFGRKPEAAICFEHAIRSSKYENWEYFKRRIDILDEINFRPMAMRTRLQAAMNVNYKIGNVSFEWFTDLIRQVAQYYITLNDEEKAISALEAFVLRSREYGKDAQEQLKTLVGMRMSKMKYQSAAKSIIVLCNGIELLNPDNTPACNIICRNGTYLIQNFPPTTEIRIEINNDLFSVEMHCNLIICLFNLNHLALALDLEDRLMRRNLTTEEDKQNVLNVAWTYKNHGRLQLAMRYLDDICKIMKFDPTNCANYHYLKGSIEMELTNSNGAIEAFETVLSIKPDHVDARIHLSTLQQNAGMFEKALEILRDFDLENGTILPDERLLARQADVLFETGDIDQFVKTTRLMLAPHFNEIHDNVDLMKKKRKTKGKASPADSVTLRQGVFNVIKGTNWERLVRRMGKTAVMSNRPTSLTTANIQDYCLKLIECLNGMEKFNDSLIVCSYAFLLPKLSKSDRSVTFQNLLYFCAIKARNWPIAFEFTRYFYTFANTALEFQLETPNFQDMLRKRIFNAMNFVFVHSQNVSYHRFIMRALGKNKDCPALQTISGNNSLITGTYRHALGEYLRVWKNNKNNSMICLLLALTFTHMSCKKDLSGRHLVCVRGIGFMKRYSKVRTCLQEVNYNIGRMFHQMAIMPLAKIFYEKVLTERPPKVFDYNEEGDEICVPALRYDLRKLAAHNLALIYKQSGNIYAARDIYEKYLVV